MSIGGDGPGSPPGNPFDGVDLALLSAEQARAITEAATDFQDVLAGRRPTFARVDAAASLPADGGTGFHLGFGYRLTIQKRLATFGALAGTIYGPILRFDEAVAPGFAAPISSTRFYTGEQMRVLLHGEDDAFDGMTARQLALP